MASILEKIGDQTDKISGPLSSFASSGVIDDLEDIIESVDRHPPIFGTDGKDEIRGTNHSDTIFADLTVQDDEGDDDIVYARKGDDLVYTFGGNDTVYGDRGDDTIQTADGDDVVDAGKGKDDVQSGRGQDIVRGGSGNDSIRGGEGDDFLYGDAGNDRVIGGSDNDTLEDGVGRDRLEGRAGDDLHLLTEDATTDTIVFYTDDPGAGVDTIRGFDAGDPEKGGDVIDLGDIAGSRFDVVQLCEDALIYVTPETAAEPVLLAIVDDVAVADLLDGNILISEDSTIEETEIDLAELIGSALPGIVEADTANGAASAGDTDACSIANLVAPSGLTPDPLMADGEIPVA